MFPWHFMAWASLVPGLTLLACQGSSLIEPGPEPVASGSALFAKWAHGDAREPRPSAGSSARPAIEAAQKHEQPPFPTEFQVTSMRGTAHAPYIDGNTVDAIRAAYRQGIGYIEVDLVLTADGTLVTAHQPYVKGCGTLSKMKLNQVLGCRVRGGLRLARLSDVLELPFKGVFLDLKDTRDKDPIHGTRAVREAVSMVLEHDRAATAVLMLYETSPESLATIEQHGLRAGLKGYPRSLHETREMVARAAKLRLEMLSVNTEWVTSDIVKSSAKQGVWHLPWSTKPEHAGHWRELAQAGAGGLIVLHYELARQQVAPHWVDARLPL